MATAQAMAALARANATRLRRVEIKRRVGARQMTLREVLMDPEAELMEMQIMELLCALPRWGPHRARRVLRDPMIRVSERQPLRLITVRQRTKILDLVG